MDCNFLTRLFHVLGSSDTEMMQSYYVNSFMTSEAEDVRSRDDISFIRQVRG
jgi:hypothetical protein